MRIQGREKRLASIFQTGQDLKEQKYEKNTIFVVNFYLLTDYLEFRRFCFSCASQMLSTAHEPSSVTLLNTLNDKVASA